MQTVFQELSSDGKTEREAFTKQADVAILGDRWLAAAIQRRLVQPLAEPHRFRCALAVMLTVISHMPPLSMAVCSPPGPAGNSPGPLLAMTVPSPTCACCDLPRAPAPMAGYGRHAID